MCALAIKPNRLKTNLMSFSLRFCFPETLHMKTSRRDFFRCLLINTSPRYLTPPHPSSFSHLTQKNPICLCQGKCDKLADAG